MRSSFFLIACFLGPVSFIFAQQSPEQLSYIGKYQELAIEEMQRTGIPASITLAQAILESAAGQSELAKMTNNHFGIKCGNNWSGAIYYKQDNNSDGNSCFRAYPTIEAGFRDHSDFLTDPKKSDRYGRLFQLAPTDYLNWAVGLQMADYATSSSYANELIGIIERYDLYQYDALNYYSESQDYQYSLAKSNGQSGYGAGREYNIKGGKTLVNSRIAPAPSDRAGQILRWQNSQMRRSLVFHPETDIDFSQDQFAITKLQEDPPGSQADRPSSYSQPYRTNSSQNEYSGNRSLGGEIRTSQPFRSTNYYQTGFYRDTPEQKPKISSLITEVHHQVGNNETLSSIAQKYKTTNKELIRLNNLEEDKIRRGMVLRVK